MTLTIIDYGAGNIKSIQFAFKRLGIEAVLSNNQETISASDKIIFPGVGEAGAAMQMLEKSKLDQLVPTLKQPVLGICLGMQLLCEFTEESNTKGLGVFNSTIKQFPNSVKVPQMGWNSISNLKSPLFNQIQENTYMYLVHSYYAELSSQTIATSVYAKPYATALQNNNFYGVQFHPEKSGRYGEQILKNFLDL